MECLKKVGELYLTNDNLYIFDYLFDSPRLMITKDKENCEGQEVRYCIFEKNGNLSRQQLLEEKKPEKFVKKEERA